MEEIRYEPIGEVRSPFETPEDVPVNPTGPTDASGTVELAPEYEEGLTDIEGFSHVVVLAHLHRVEGYALQASPPFAPGANPGIFATSGPRRPNPIAQSVLRLRDVDGVTLSVDWLDLVDGTPVLDVKPHAPKPHECKDIRIGWLEDIHEE